MKFTNFKKIKRVTFKYPELMDKDSEQKVIDLFNTINTLKDNISDIRSEANLKEKELVRLQEEWNTINKLIIVDYETYEKEVINNEVNIGFKFSADINKDIH